MVAALKWVINREPRLIYAGQWSEDCLEGICPFSKSLLVSAGGTSCFPGTCILWDPQESEGHLLERLSAPLPKEDKDEGILSQREREILALLANGLSNKEISDRLRISINTVITHRRNISAKLNIRSMAALTVYAMMHGLL